MINKTRTLILFSLLVAMLTLPQVIMAQSTATNIRPVNGYWTMTLSEETFASCLDTETIRIDTIELYEQLAFTILLERGVDRLLVNRVRLNRVNVNEYIGVLSADGEDTVQLLITVEGARAFRGSLIITYRDEDTWCSTTTPLTGRPN